ncbi:hypothetical protein HPP92_007104 [Vanilla planifolia]|uniref:Uncharacterized protein n=1 Tax=Vanilla planifolia TaxID=51239 RepID=A0A835RD82_VANPL|nr:hypothetical protein HPP92_007104 [Vanilla planifolia]
MSMWRHSMACYLVVWSLPIHEWSLLRRTFATEEVDVVLPFIWMGRFHSIIFYGAATTTVLELCATHAALTHDRICPRGTWARKSHALAISFSNKEGCPPRNVICREAMFRTWAYGIPTRGARQLFSFVEGIARFDLTCQIMTWGLARCFIIRSYR